jgi:nodulation protein E
MTRIVVTGLGAVTAFGAGIPRLDAGLRAGVPALAPFRPDFAPDDYRRMAGRVPPEALAGDDTEGSGARLGDRATRFAVLAAREAIAATPRLDPRTTAVLVGTGAAGFEAHEAGFHRLYAERRTRAHPLSVLRGMACAPSAQLSIALGLRGPTLTVTTACASGTHAIGEALWMLRSGRVEAAVAVGTEACLTYGSMLAWDALHVMAADTCRPFSIGRSGLVLAEGAAALLLETEDAAKRRGAPLLAEIAGYAASADAGDVIQPDIDSIAATMAAALADSGVDAAEIDHVNAHGTGTELNDRAEAAALYRVFGARAGRIPVSATKALHGHALGAGGAIEAIAAILAMRGGYVPPTANHLGVDPGCALDVVPNAAREAACRVALSNSFAFGGMNAVLCVRCS